MFSHVREYYAALTAYHALCVSHLKYEDYFCQDEFTVWKWGSDVLWDTENRAFSDIWVLAVIIFRRIKDFEDCDSTRTLNLEQVHYQQF